MPGSAGDGVRIKRSVRAGDDVRPVGVDIQAGQEVARRASGLALAEIGPAGDGGSERVCVSSSTACGRAVDRRRAWWSRADALRPGQIRDSNRFDADGGDPRGGCDAGRPGHRTATARATLCAASNAVCWKRMYLLTSGGVSMGDLDLMKPLLERTGDDPLRTHSDEAGQAADVRHGLKWMAACDSFSACPATRSAAW